METPSELIRAAFKKLNPKYTVHGSTMNEIITMGLSPKQYAEQLLHRERPFPGMPVPKYHAARMSCSLNTAEKQIKQLESATKKLQTAFEALNSTTIYALVQSGFDYLSVEKVLEMLQDTSGKAPKVIKDWKKKHPEFRSMRSGRPKSGIPFHIAKVLADEYHRATGKTPMVATDANKDGHPARGDFIELVKAVFKALNITASPESMARKSEALWRDREEIKNTQPKLIMRRKAGKITIQSNPDSLNKKTIPS